MRRWRSTPQDTDHALARSRARSQRVRRDGYALDNEEFLPGLVCVAVLVPAAEGGALAANLCVAVQAPAMRLSADEARCSGCRRCSALRSAGARGRIDVPAASGAPEGTSTAPANPIGAHDALPP